MANINNIPLSTTVIKARIAKIKKGLYKFLAPLVLSALALTSCLPEGTIIETKPAITQAYENPDPSDETEITLETGIETAILSVTPEISASPENTPTMTATATPENTATPEATATPEMTEQEKIRAEFAAAGIDPDNLANSTNEWVNKFTALESWQEKFEDLSGESLWKTAIVLSLEQVDSFEELERAITTDGGWQLLQFAKVGWKKANGDLAIGYLPMVAYHQEEEILWYKTPWVGITPSVFTGQITHNIVNRYMTYENDGFNKKNQYVFSTSGDHYYLGPGTFMRILTEYPRNFVSANECMIEWQWNSAVGTVPYSEEEMLEFRQTGDPAAFDYYQLNGEIVFWPIVNFDASINRADRYPDDMDFEQFNIFD